MFVKKSVNIIRPPFFLKLPNKKKEISGELKYSAVLYEHIYLGIERKCTTLSEIRQKF